jgi:hypothetical protein
MCFKMYNSAITGLCISKFNKTPTEIQKKAKTYYLQNTDIIKIKCQQNKNYLKKSKYTLKKDVWTLIHKQFKYAQSTIYKKNMQ